MFFGLIPIDDHPCCKLQDVVECFFVNSVATAVFSLELFPDWFRATLSNPTCALADKFCLVHTLLHFEGIAEGARRSIAEQVLATNCVQNLCDGVALLPVNNVDWQSALGQEITVLMSSLYDSLDLVVFRRDGQQDEPTRQLYREFIKRNNYVCPFCGLDKFKNKRGASREDFDHYLHKSGYPFAASNVKNLVPTCGTCNQDYKKTQNILADGVAFYPYSAIPEVKLEVDCQTYPSVNDLSDPGKWIVKLELSESDPTANLKMTAWNRVYSIKKRLENEISEFFEDWMQEVSDSQTQPVETEQFMALIASAKFKATESGKRRMQPCQIIKAAFFDFMLSRADAGFIESFRRLQNARYS